MRAYAPEYLKDHPVTVTLNIRDWHEINRDLPNTAVKERLRVQVREQIDEVIQFFPEFSDTNERGEIWQEK